MKNTLRIVVLYFFCLTNALFCTEKKFVIVIPSYNNCRWYKKNLDSALGQKYGNYRIIYVDDASTDGTGTLVAQYIRLNSCENKVTLILNKKRHRKMANLYKMVHLCHDDEIVVELDGDDWYAHDRVLETLNAIYQDPDIWMTYGNIQRWPSQKLLNPLKPIPAWVVAQNSYRATENMFFNHQMQLRTYYAWLFKKIRLRDLFFNGKFVEMTADSAIMWPMYEMAGGRFKFIDEPLYVHNVETPLNDHKVDLHLQQAIDTFFHNRQPYIPVGAILAESRVGDRLIDLIVTDHIANEEVLRTINNMVKIFPSIINRVFVLGNSKKRLSCEQQKNLSGRFSFYFDQSIRDCQSSVVRALLESKAHYFLLVDDFFDFSAVDLAKKVEYIYDRKADGYSLLLKTTDLKVLGLPTEKIADEIYTVQARLDLGFETNKKLAKLCILNKRFLFGSLADCHAVILLDKKR